VLTMEVFNELNDKGGVPSGKVMFTKDEISLIKWVLEAGTHSSTFIPSELAEVKSIISKLDYMEKNMP
jgi:hypothetical protein